MATYTELAMDVKNWANRDTEVLTYDRIRQCIRYAHDECYRTLRIAPLEITRSGIVKQNEVDQRFLRIEDDLVEFIQLRKVASEGPRSYSPYDKRYIVAEAHSDARSFQGDTLTLYSDYAFYREGTEIHIWPRIQLAEEWELYYYRRLPEANERWDIDEVLKINDNEGNPIVDESGNIELLEFNKYFELFSHEEVDPDDPDNNIVVTDLPLADREADSSIPEVGMTLADLGLTITYPIPNPDGEFDTTDTFIGILKEQWLRDVNEKVLLFGALHQAFDYLDEPDQSEKYKNKFEQEIFKLNKEDMDRMNSGGNINVNFYNRLI